MAAQRFRPTRENREAALQRLVDECDLPSETRARYQKSNEDDLSRYISDRNVGGVANSAVRAFYEYMREAVPLIFQGREDGLVILKRAFSVFYWGTEINLHDRRKEKVADDLPDDSVVNLVWLHGLACASRCAVMSSWISEYLLRIVPAGLPSHSVMMLDPDVPFRTFALTLFLAEAEGSWPSTFDTDAMRGYGGVLRHAGNEKGLPEALVEYSDFRLAQTWGFDGMDASKRRPSSVHASVFEGGGWIGLFPLELFSLKNVFERVTGRSLSLAAQHPLLNSDLMQIPTLLPLHEDNMILRMKDLGREAFGANWKPVIEQISR